MGIAAILLLPLGYVCLWPLVDRVTSSRTNPSALQTALTAMALSLGGLSLMLFLVGMLPGRLIQPVTVAALILTAWAAGFWLNRGWFAPRRWLTYWRNVWQQLIRFDVPALLMWGIIGVGLIVLINALYYPFIGDDTILRYGLHAKIIYNERSLPSDVLGYPPLAALTFVSTYFAAGEINEHLARVFAFAMSMGTIGATYLIGREVRNRQTGLLAAFMIAVTPIFIRNSTLAYVDIPTAFTMALAMLYALQWWRTGHWRDALLAGLMAAVALFTKQAALTLLASLFVIPLGWLIQQRARKERLKSALIAWGAFLLPPLLLAGPWYLRNAILSDGTNVLPIAGYLYLLQPGLGWRGAIPVFANLADYGLMWPLYALGWLFAAWMIIQQGVDVLRGKQASHPDVLILSAWVIPYWLAWWLEFSFDPRFLLLILPAWAVWVAMLLNRGVETLLLRLTIPMWGQRAAAIAIIATLFLTGTRIRWGGIYRAITQPTATDAEILREAKGAVYDLSEYAVANFDPVTDRLYSLDERHAYYLYGFDLTIGYPGALSDLEGYDYILYSSSFSAVYTDPYLAWESEFFDYAYDARVFEPVYESGGVPIMRILRTSSPE